MNAAKATTKGRCGHIIGALVFGYANEASKRHINGPLLHEADYLVERVLNLQLGRDKDEKQKPWPFCNTAESLAKNATAWISPRC